MTNTSLPSSSVTAGAVDTPHISISDLRKHSGATGCWSHRDPFPTLQQLITESHPSGCMDFFFFFFTSPTHPPTHTLTWLCMPACRVSNVASPLGALSSISGVGSSVRCSPAGSGLEKLAAAEHEEQLVFTFFIKCTSVTEPLSSF